MWMRMTTRQLRMWMRRSLSLRLDARLWRSASRTGDLVLLTWFLAALLCDTGFVVVMFLAAVLVAWRLSFVGLVFPLLFALSRQNLLVFGRVFVCENRAGDRKVRWSGVGGLCAD